ncbi:MAG TPA: helix-turn-helix domain-containing protein [Candidatus Limnocylindrales bacterium]|jgi:transcriptional regulator with XRE-family HTH domain|nr:helix-turn-helix domain-containing protein [Candidatus Limnocylindrales bacterium]
MNASRLGRFLRAIRVHQRLSQQAIADRAGISQSVYSRAERGDLEGMTIGSLDRVTSALGGSLSLDVRYRGGLGDRLLDAAHAALVDRVVGVLARADWLTELEFGFNVFGDRGSVDVLAWHLATRTLLIVEVKSRFTDLQAMLLSLARKLRVVPDVARTELGWDALTVARIVVAPGTTENRSILSQHAAMFDVALPARALAIRRWLQAPSGPIAGVWLVSMDAMSRGRASGDRR